MAKPKPLTKKDMLKTKCIHVPIFGGWVVLTLDRAEHERYLEWMRIDKRDWPENEFYDGCGFCGEYFSPASHTVIVHICDWRLDTLVHELSHAVFKILDHRGVETGSGSRETFCYLLDYLFAELYPPTMKRWQKEEDKIAAAKAKSRLAKEKKNDPA